MNYIWMFSWLYGDEDTCQEGSREFYYKLRNGIERGIRFPFECKYQVHLLKNQLATEWVVAVLVMLNTHEDDSIEQGEKLEKWFTACGTSRWDDRVVKRMHGSTIQSTLAIYALSYEYIDCFGTLDKGGIVENTIKHVGYQSCSNELTKQQASFRKKWWQFWK